MKKITKAQREALKKLSNQWASSYSLRVGMNTLDALVRKGLVERKGVGALGSLFSPQTTIKYRLKNEQG